MLSAMLSMFILMSFLTVTSMIGAQLNKTRFNYNNPAPNAPNIIPTQSFLRSITNNYSSILNYYPNPLNNLCKF